MKTLWSLYPCTFLLIFLLTWPCGGSQYVNDESSEENFGQSIISNETDVGLSPPVGNLATTAIITSNATCGQKEPETFCKLVEHVNIRSRPSQCQICDAHSSDKTKRHPISYAIDGSDRWWQSPSLQNGKKYEWVTITIDLKQIYQVAYIVIKAALSPRPGNWILEKSLDGVHFHPWQYYAMSDEECWTRYGIPAKPGKPSYTEDDEVICTSYFSRITPLEGGEIHTSLVNGRPGAEGPTEVLVKFTMSRYVRLRLQKIRTLHADLMGVGGDLWDKTVMRRYFYSIKDIAIGGHCVCFGHSSECVKQPSQNVERCLCRHNTCGEQCDMCCPLYNQYPWGPGNSTASAACEKCECYNHADSCVYDPQVHIAKKSINIFGTNAGGGVCLGCKAHTKGINCEKCEVGYYRPQGVALDDPNPCVKCECKSPGSTGTCVTQERCIAEGKNVGDCTCKLGYSGKFCTECTIGFRGYPKCEPCPCNLDGIVNMDCEGDCICKRNVEGKFCSKCKTGYFNLEKTNPYGCTPCFCHGVSIICRSSNFTVTEITNNDTWLVTDLHGTKILPGLQIGETYHVANEEFSNFEKYYWKSNGYFTGNNIGSYGLQIVFSVSWVEARGDTSGRPIQDFGVIIQSVNSMLAFSHRVYEGSNATITITLSEHGCYVVPDVDNSIIQVNGDTELGIPCTRYDIMEALSDIKEVLFRAKYHTDQIEGMFHRVQVEKADFHQFAIGTEIQAKSIEICTCPKGYTGNSCEYCDYGYRKSDLDSWLNECIKCDCNSHSSSCDIDGTCHACEHNTTGNHCEKCFDGLYGDPTTELPNSCKICECPLSIFSNNFSPTCTSSGTGYICSDCQIGYEGLFCERCSNGYFGNPSQPEDYCKPCDCNAGEIPLPIISNENICDHLTGECFLCPKNTIGWKCDECLKGYYGNPLNSSCIPCDCNIFGAVGPICHFDTGQCDCNERFTGKQCGACIPGCGNVEQGCPICSCDPLGSISLNCDQTSGQCHCKSGVTGRYCNQCLEYHFGFSATGCHACDCHDRGSDSKFCDLITGQCHCLKNVIDRDCHNCSVGYWNIQSGNGCEFCDCNPIGSEGNICDIATGQCRCKPGVGGLQCSHCLEHHFGFSSSGCKACDLCTEIGHICDEETGRCVCPPNAEGPTCSKCTVGFWGNPSFGCKPCNCSIQGSTSPQCATETGKCACVNGYDGDKCNFCQFGFYNYPNCGSCGCDISGTIETYCKQNGVCSCDQYGQCPCKKNVIGPTCNKCKDGAYGLSKSNEDGCIDCFCFQRTNKCSEGYFKWQKYGLLNAQTLSVKQSRNSGETHQYFPYTEGQDHCYVYLALPNQRDVVPSWQSRLRLNIINNLIVIPESGSDVLIEKDVSFSAPLYWQLPHIFLGDKVLSYNGFIRFRVVTEAVGTTFPNDVLASYPLIQIQGNHRLILEYFPTHFSTNGFYEVKLHGDSWRLKHGPLDGVVTKEIMMVALQNLQHVLIRGTNSPEILKATLFNVSIDIAILSPQYHDRTLAHGIEVCECPPQYNSTSCQNPKIGYYRWYKKEYITSTVIIDLVGEARPCQCNGRSSTCDTETGFCQDCVDNTGGNNCEQCAKGFYGNPIDRCLPCPCPTVWNGHADSCLRIRPGHFQCFCQLGYTGKSCERCDYGYFGNPDKIGGFCQPCQCNTYGSVSDECDEVTGQCNCRNGITGRDCSKCAQRNIIIGKMCTSCDDACTGRLLNDLDKMALNLNGFSLNANDAAVWQKLHYFQTEWKQLSSNLSTINKLPIFLNDLPTFNNLAAIMLARAIELQSNSKNLLEESIQEKKLGDRLLNLIFRIQSEIHSNIQKLNNYVFHDHRLFSYPAVLQQAKDILDFQKLIKFQDSEYKASTELSLASDAYRKAFNLIFKNLSTSDDINIKRITDRLDDLKQYISQALKDQSQADRIILAARELLGTGKANAAAIDSMILEMDMKNVLALDVLNRGAHVLMEMNEVLRMLEDLIRNLRNMTKEIEIQENDLFEFVPLYRVQFAQPAFDHVEMLKQKAKYLEELFSFAISNSSKSFQAITAYDRIRAGFESALAQAKNAANVSKEASIRIQTLLRQYPLESITNDSDTLIEDGFTLRHILEKSIHGRLTEYKDLLENVKWRLQSANVSLKVINNQIGHLHESRFDLQISELLNQIRGMLGIWDEIGGHIQESEIRIDTELLPKFHTLKQQADFNPDRVDNLMDEVGRNLNQARSKSIDVESVKSRKESRMDNADEKMKHLKALIALAKHKSDAVKVSIGPDETGTCFRLYKWPVVGGATAITFNFAPIKTSDSLLFYWPSSITEDFVAIQMVNLQLKAIWDLGSGVKNLTHPLKLTQNTEAQLDDPDIWYHISYDRVGSDVAFGVGKVDSSTPQTAVTEEILKYPSEVDENSTVMNMGRNDLIHIGGISKLRRPGLVTNGLSGCIHNLRVNYETIGLWNFVGNEGCAPCTECSASIIDAQNIERDYYFDGRGYSIVKRIQSQAFYSKSFDINMEFRTYAESGLLFITVNEVMGQSLSLEIHNGQVIFKARHSWTNLENSIYLETTGEKLNTGKWIKVQALWVYQKFLQTGQLSVVGKQYTQQVESSDVSLELYNAPYQIGGLSPEFYSGKLNNNIGTNISFVGCLKNLLIDGNTYDPLSDQYHGVETPCGGKKIHVTSFEGNGYAEYPSRTITKDKFKLGFSFKTTSPTGLLLLSAFSKKANTSEEPFYAVYLENGEIYAKVNFGNSHGEITLQDKFENRYDDGKIHDFRLVRKLKKFLLFMDDEQVGRENIQAKPLSIPISSRHGLFIGGASRVIQEKFSRILSQIQKGFAGCIENLYFDDQILNFNHPIAHQNQNLGQCPIHFNSIVVDRFGGEYFSKIQALAHVQPIPEEDRCPGIKSEIEHENLHSALHFGDSLDSYVAIPLEGSRNLRQQFNLTFYFRTFYPNGLIFHGVKKKGEEYHILSYLKDGQLIFKFANRLWSQELVSSFSNLNDGKWQMVSIIKADDKMYLYINSQITSEARVVKRMKQIGKLYLGGIPIGGSDFLENSVQKPDHFKGCIKKLIINSHEYEFNATSVVRHHVNPCFRQVEAGSFFGGDSYAIYMYNFTFNNPIELEMEFRTNSKNGELLTFIPDFSRQSSSFSIYLRDGQVVASDVSGSVESLAIESFPQNPEYLCDEQWHSVKANFLGRSISLKVDTFTNVDSLMESSTRIHGSWRAVTGTLFIGGHDGRSYIKRPGFHGCIKNILINQYRKDWSDMAVLNNVFLNSCPI